MATDLDLQNFLPFRLARLAHEVSNRLSEIYAEQFDISIAEWRVLAALSDHQPCTAHRVAASTRTHKSTISRAVSRLIENRWIERVASSTDRRQLILRFTVSGRTRFDQIVPLVLKFEQDMLSVLDKSAKSQLTGGIDQLEKALGLGQHKA